MEWRCLGLMALVVSASGTTFGAAVGMVVDKATPTCQQLVAVLRTAGGDTGGAFSVFRDLGTSSHGVNGISSALVYDVAAAAGEAVVSDDTRQVRDAPALFAHPLALRRQAVNGASRPSADGSSNSASRHDGDHTDAAEVVDDS